MAMLLPLTTWAQGTFDVTIATSEWEYDAGVTQPAITVTSSYGELNSDQYDILFSLQNGNGETDGLTSVKDVGVYTITVKGKGLTQDYTPNSEVTFTITPKELSKVDVKSLKKMYGDDEVSFEVNSLEADNVELTGNELENAKKCLTFEVVGNKTFEDAKQANAGEKFQVTISGINKKPEDAVSNYHYTAPESGNTTKTLEITQRPLVVSLEGLWKTYDGKNMSTTSLAGSRKITYGGAGIYNNEAVTISLKGEKGETGFKDAGEYNVIVTLTDAEVNNNYYIANENNIAVLKIDRAELTIKKKSTVGDIDMTYGQDEDLKDNFDISFTDKDNENKVYEKYAMKANFENGNNGVNEAGYEILPYYQAEGSDKFELVTDYNEGVPNYVIKYEDVATVKVTPKAITGATVTVNNTTYQGQKFNAAGTYTVGEGEDATEKDIVTVTFEGNTLDKKYYIVEVVATDGGNATNAAEQFKVKVTGKGNYEGSAESTDQTIERALLTIVPNEETRETLLKKEYDGVVGDRDVTEAFKIEGFVGEENAGKIGLSLRRENKKTVGKYKVQPHNGDNPVYVGAYATSFTNYKIDRTQYNPEDETNMFEITPKEIEYWIAGAEKPYDGNPAKTDDLTIEVEEDALAPGDDIKTIFEADHAPIIEFATEEAPVNANEQGYTLVLKNETELIAKNYDLTHKSESDGKYVIKKAEMTIKAPTVNLKFGETLTDDDLKTKVEDYNITSIQNAGVTNTNVASEERSVARQIITFTIDKAKEANFATGTYPIVVNVIEDVTTEGLTDAQKKVINNYTFIKHDGELNIGVVEKITLDGDVEKKELPEDSEEELTDDQMTVAQKIAKYNGATVKEVTLKNLKSLMDAGFKNDGRWYTLVLPFDVTVRELSNAFGYAIVNVPNTLNTDPNTAAFRLEMGEVPANTLMAFKVDNTLDNMEGDSINLAEGVKFYNKTIVAPDENEWARDGAEHYFIGVYEPTEITKENECYLNPKQGTFKPASDQPNSDITGGYGMLINALNGYVLFDNADYNPTLARVILEGADGSTTSISVVTGEVINNTAEGWYTIGGVKLEGEPTQKGVYINNGKKVVIK